MMHVRPATPEDVVWMLAQAADFDAFVDTRHQVFGNDAGRILNDLIDQQPVFVSELQHPTAGAVQTGMLIAVVHPHLFNPELVVLTELLWWVAPEYRATRAAALLLHAFEETAKRIGADWVVMSLEAKSPLNPDALEKRGYRLQERSYLMERTPAPRRV